MAKFIGIFTTLTIISSLFLSFQNIDLAQAKTHSAKKTSTSNAPVSDADFININGLSAAQVQSILSTNGSFLRNFSEGGRSAAQIIWDAAHGHGDASGSINGISIRNTINPAAILATLQKEQSLVYMKDRNDGALRAAMGYGCPDGGGCDGKYAGFTKQVENGAWQLRYNYERAKSHGFTTYQVGQTIILDGQKVYLANRTMASLYRYTPHLGVNFNIYFNKWFGGAAATASTGADTSNCDTLSSKSARRLCKINLAKGVAVSTAAPAATASTNCETLASKSQRRLCRIQAATGQVTANNAPAATSSITLSTNCEAQGSKTEQRACRIEKTRLQFLQLLK